MRTVFYLSLLLFLVFSCTPADKSAIQKGRDGFARHFDLDSSGNYQTLTIFSPKTGKVERKYALVKHGEEVKLPNDLVRIDVPVKHMAALSTTFIGMLHELKALDIIAITTDKKYVWDPAVRKRIDQGKVMPVSFDQQLAPEDLLARKVNLVMYSGFGQDFPNADKLLSLGIHCMPNYDWEEAHPLGKAEWIKVFGALICRDKEAAEYFDQLCSNYEKLKADKPQTKSKKVLAGCLTSDVWYAPAGESFLAGIMRDAGIDYLYATEKGTASLALTLERVSKDERSCAIWINAEATTLAGLKKINPKLASFQTYKKGKVYSYMHRTSYFWEMSTIHPDWLLQDFIRIGHQQPGKLYFYKRLLP